MENRVPEIVYKYRDWDNSFHKNILIYNELYLPAPKEFNDPFDCKIPRNFHALTPVEIENFKDDLAIKNFSRSEEDGRDFKKILEDLDKRIENIDEFQENYNEFYFAQMNKYYGILSMSKIWNGILLWSHYANNHKGFCVGFNEEKLRNAGQFCRSSIVSYKSFPIIKPVIKETDEERFNRIQTQTTTKSKDWDCEEEYRFIRCFYPHEPKPFERLIKVKEAISEVIIGVNTSDENKEEIIAICRRDKIPVYQAKKVPFGFAIDRDLI